MGGAKVGKLMGKLVAYTFADGVDIDMEHLTPYSGMDDEFGALISFITTLRNELNDVTKNWAANAKARSSALEAQFAKLAPWQKGSIAGWFNTQTKCLAEVATNDPP